MSSHLLRPSRVLRILRSGGVAKCVKINLADACVTEIAAQAGFDCVWHDLEHVPNSMRDIEHATLAAKAHDCDMLVRVAKGSYSDMVRPLEVDAAGIMVPHVMSANEAKQIAHQTRFHPIGRRALDGGNADGAYATVPTAPYIDHANAERFVIVQIEDPEAMDELDGIAATPGIDMLFFGPGDYSQGLGVPGKLNDPRVDEARRAIAQAAQRHGK
ncbi:MAG: aldolase/citrate lyase family protein, partial [Phycisphaeraceae bacterium]